ncbi:MAG: NAD(P)H-binding protein [Planctomycetota bacterium]|nr:NAD(P)H-binding protein [Planctomycetota bacterium]
MNVVIVGGSGLIGTKLTRRLRERGCAVTPVSPSTGVDTVTGTGVAEAVRGAECIVDVTNSPSFADDAVMAFFRASTGNLIRAAAAAGVRHYVALSIVGADDLPDSGYMRAKVVQENLVRAGGVPFTIVRSTQFFEFLAAVADAATRNGEIRVPAIQMQPIAADDVAAQLAEVVVGRPQNGVVEIAGPEALPMAVLIERRLAAKADPRRVVVDEQAGYFGAHAQVRTLVPRGVARVGTVDLARWLRTAE